MASLSSSGQRIKIKKTKRTKRIKGIKRVKKIKRLKRIKKDEEDEENVSSLLLACVCSGLVCDFLLTLC